VSVGQPSVSDDLAQLQVKLGDMYHSVLIEKKYNAHQLKLLKRCNFALEFLLAAGTSTTIGKWGIWGWEGGWHTFWIVFSALVVLLSIVKLIAPIPTHIERYSKAVTGYLDLSFELDSLLFDIKINRKLVPRLMDSFARMQKRRQELAQLSDPSPRKKLFKKLYLEAQLEIVGRSPQQITLKT
jgi:hypothetical protein